MWRTENSQAAGRPPERSLGLRGGSRPSGAFCRRGSCPRCKARRTRRQRTARSAQGQCRRSRQCRSGGRSTGCARGPPGARFNTHERQPGHRQALQAGGRRTSSWAHPTPSQRARKNCSMTARHTSSTTPTRRVTFTQALAAAALLELLAPLPLFGRGARVAGTCHR